MKKIKIVGALLFFVIFLATVGLEIVQWYNFKMKCGDYLKITGDAPNIYLADEYLKKAIYYLERTGKTKGNSAYFIKTPKNDLEIWYKQLKGAEETLGKLIQAENNGEQIPQLIKDNALMKIREVVIDVGRSGTEVTHPNHIHIFPYQLLFLIIEVISLIGAVTLLGV